METVKGRWGIQLTAAPSREGAAAADAQPEAEEEDEEVEGAALLSAARTAWSASGETEAATQQVRTRHP